MRNFKRFLALMLTVLMVAGCFAIPTSAAASDKFDDVDQYVDAIDTLAAIGVVTGKSETTFGTDEAVQRYQAALLFARALTGKTDNAVWQTGVNNSVFADLDENPQDLFVNAISYANNNGIVTGKSATKFAPRDGITLEQGLTMAVRALGYETAAMKASATTGLWMYIDKAISLGLDAGLEDITDYKATLTRGQMAQLIYNMIFVETADGYTYAAKAFNLLTETFVLTSTNTTKYDIGDDGIKLAAPGYVGLSVLAEDGTLGKCYYFEAKELAKALGLEETYNFSAVIGYSYDVIADDTLSVIYDIAQNKVDTFENTLDTTDFTIFATGTGANGNLTVDGKNYTVVETYTKKLWNRDVKNTANTETLFYNWSQPDSKAASEFFYYDENGNIVDKDGNKLLYLVSNFANNNAYNSVFSSKTYMVKDETTGTYRLPTAADWAKATNYIQNSNSLYYLQETKNTDLVSAAKYGNLLFAEIVAIDDDGDDAYDRMFFTKYQFGYYDEYTSGTTAKFKITNANGGTYIDDAISGWTITNKPADGSYIVFAINQTANFKEVIVKDVIAAKTGYVNGFNSTGSITIDGTPLSIGSPIALDGILSVASMFDTNGMFKGADLIGKYVKYYQIGSTVVAFSAADASTFIVFDGVVTVTADNELMAKVYFPGQANAQLIPVASLNGYPLSQYALGGQLNYVYSTLLAKNEAPGELMTAAKDDAGKYHIYEIADADRDTYKDKTIAANVEVAGKITYTNGSTTLTNVAANGFYFKNGVAYKANTYTAADAQFQANASTLFVFTDDEKIVGTFSGKPVDGSYFTLGNNGNVVYQCNNLDKDKTAAIVYVNDAASVYGSFSETGYDTIIYVDNASIASVIMTNTYNGTEWTYTNVIDIVNGKNTTVKAVSTNVGAYGLKRDGFYYVKNGYVVAEAKPTDFVDVTLDEIGLVLGSVGLATINKNTELENLKTVLAWNGSVIAKGNDNVNVQNFLGADLAKWVNDADNDKHYDGTMISYDIAGKQAYTIILDKVPTADNVASYKKEATDALIAGVKADIKSADAKDGKLTIVWNDTFKTLTSANKITFKGTNLHNVFNVYTSATATTPAATPNPLTGEWDCGQAGFKYEFLRSNGGAAATLTIVIDGVDVVTYNF